MTQWHGIRFGYHLTRHLRLVGNTLEAKYELENLAPFDFHFVWAMHSLMAFSAPVQLATAGDKSWRWSHDAAGGQKQLSFQWPLVHSEQDLSRPADLPAGKGWKVFSSEPISKPFTIAYPTRKRSLSISYASDSNIAAYWGVWINTGGGPATATSPWSRPPACMTGSMSR